MEWSSTDTQRKRPPSDDLLEEQPLSKRLERLSLVRQEQLLNGTREKAKSPKVSTSAALEGERMDVDNVVFIRDLDEEINEVEDDDNGLVFLPDIEKRLTRIPYNLARGVETSPASSGSTALVLYSVPTSLSVSEEKDNVRRVIAEARNRVRQVFKVQQKQVDETLTLSTHERDLEGSGTDVNPETQNGFLGDPDAMDIE